MQKHRTIVAVAICLSTLPVAMANDGQVVLAPDGWEFSPSNTAIAATRSALALVAFRYQSDYYDRYAASRIVQISDSGEVSTDLPGKVSSIAYAASGSHLLAFRGYESRSYVDLIGADGSVRWTKQDARRFEFSLDGSRLLATPARVDVRRSGSAEFEVFDVEGNRLRSIDAGRPTDGAVMIDEQVIVFGFGRSVAALRFGSGAPEDFWSVLLPQSDPSLVDIIAFEGALVRLIHRRNGGWSILDVRDGTILHRFDPAALASADSERTPEDFGRLGAYPGTTAGKIVLWDRRGTALEATIGTSELDAKSLDGDPQGFSQTGELYFGRRALVAEDRVLLETIFD